jgi:hypothetical protein
MNKKLKTSIFYLFVIMSIMLGSLGMVSSDVIAAGDFTGEEFLGRPEADRISVSIVPAVNMSVYYQYGTTSGGPYSSTSTVAATAGQSLVVVISGLSANTRYYYRMQYSTNGGSTWTARTEHSFWTQRAVGSSFTFDITTDSHIDIMLGSTGNWNNTLTRVAADSPDFVIDLGDTTAMDNGSTSVTLGDTAATAQVYINTLTYLNKISANSALFMIAGNHEQQEAWHLQGTLANSLPIMGKNAEKKYYLNPLNDSFYSGDTTTVSDLSGDHTIQDYYAWTWGDALFVVISPFWTTSTKPYTTTVGGGETDATGSGDRWDWTLGVDQYNWLQTTLSASTAKYKFIFAHQIVGGNGLSSPNQVNYGHGGADSANLVEWGGYDVGGSLYTWATNRPSADGWGALPIHQMLVANHVTAFFHGHDHQMGYEMVDGIVYQSVPSASFTGSFGIYSTGGNSGKTIWADSTQGAGYLRVTVGSSQTTVDFIRYNGSSAAYTYTMAPATVTTHNLTTAVDPGGAGTITPSAGVHPYDVGTVVNVTAAPASGYEFDHWGGDCTGSGACSVTMSTDRSVTAYFSAESVGKLGDVNGDGEVTSTDALIILSGDVGLDVSQFCPINCGDVNDDGEVTSTDALIILSFDVGISVPYPVGEAGECPENVTPCPGCNP